MKTIISCLFFVLLTGCASVLTQPESQEIYVATNGYHGNGSFEHPYRTIQEAVDVAQAGDTIYIRGGSYHEKIIIKNSGKKNQPITLRNYQQETVVIDGSQQKTTKELDGLLIIKNQQYITLDGLSFVNFSSDNENVPTGVLLTGTSHHIIVNQCRISNITTKNPNPEQANAHALAVYGTDSVQAIHHIEITNCEISQNILGLSETVVLNGNVENFNIARNKIHDNDNIGIDMIGFEGTASQNDFARDGFCEENELWNNSTTNNPSYNEASAASIYVDGGRNIVIQRNVIWASDIGVEAASEHQNKTTKQIVIRNNLIYDCLEIAGIAFGGYDEQKGSATEIKIYNNTLVNNAVHIFVQEHAQVTSNEIINNIFYLGETYEGDLTQIKHTPNFYQQPKFVDEKKHDFHLRKDSSARNTGIISQWVGDDDLDGNSRINDKKINFGAYQ